MKERETFGSRLGFILVSAGCAIGLGNVWKFPYMAGKFGGAAFILIYLVFLVILGLPILICEFAVGRASRRSTAKAFHMLEPEGSNFHKFSYFLREIFEKTSSDYPQTARRSSPKTLFQPVIFYNICIFQASPFLIFFHKMDRFLVLPHNTFSHFLLFIQQTQITTLRILYRIVILIIFAIPNLS